MRDSSNIPFMFILSSPRTGSWLSSKWVLVATLHSAGNWCFVLTLHPWIWFLIFSSASAHRCGRREGAHGSLVCNHFDKCSCDAAFGVALGAGWSMHMRSLGTETCASSMEEQYLIEGFMLMGKNQSSPESYWTMVFFLWRVHVYT